MRNWLRSGPSPSLKSWVEVLKSLVEIGAVFVAAWWAHTRFFQGEAPSLEERGQIESSVKWTSHDDQHCLAIFGVSIKNIGRRSFDLDNINVEMWMAPQLSGKGMIVRIDPEAFMARPPAHSFQIREGSIVGHYAPDFALSDDYVFIVPRDQSKLAFFRFRAEGNGSDSERRVAFDDYRWTGNCETEYSEESPP